MTIDMIKQKTPIRHYRQLLDAGGFQVGKHHNEHVSTGVTTINNNLYPAIWNI